MGNSDKTDKPEDDQVKAENAKAEEIEDAELVDEETNADGETPVELDEPDAEPVEATEDVVSEAVSDVVEETAPDADAPDVEETPDAASAPEKRGGFAPMVLGGVVAAAIGFGGAVFFGDQLGIGSDTEETLAKVAVELEAQKQALASLGEQSGSASERASSASQNASDAAAEVAKLRELLDAYTTELGTLSQTVAEFDSRLNDIEKRPLNEGLGAAAIAAYEREVEDLKALVAEQKAEAAQLKDKADLSAKAALARSATTRIVAALDSGAAYSGALVDYRSATGEEVPEVLAENAGTGVITLAALIEGYPEAARAALAKARAEKIDDAQGSALGNFLKNQLGARSVEAKDGTDTDAILSRAEAALRDGQLFDALAELDSLADAPKAEIAEWRAQAETRLAATEAAEAMAQALNTN